jgi:hypothetical protein
MRALAALAVLALSAGCGYGFVASGLPPELGPMAITEFSNDTTQAGLGHACAGSLRDRLGVGGNPGMASADDARLVVIGRVTGLRENPLALGAGGVDMELEVTVAVRVVGAGGAVLYDDEVRGVDSARASAGAGASSLARSAAARRACADAMNILVDDLDDAIDGMEGPRGEP